MVTLTASQAAAELKNERNAVLRMSTGARTETETLRTNILRAANESIPLPFRTVLSNLSETGHLTKQGECYTADLTALARLAWLRFPPLPASLVGEGIQTDHVASTAPRKTKARVTMSVDNQRCVRANDVNTLGDNRRQEELRQQLFWQRLEEMGTQYVPYDLAVVNPHSFSQTVENAFDLAHLIRKGHARIICYGRDEHEIACIEQAFADAGHPWEFDGKPVSLIFIIDSDPNDVLSDRDRYGRIKGQCRGRCVAPRSITLAAFIASVKRFGITECLTGDRKLDPMTYDVIHSDAGDSDSDSDMSDVM